MRQRNMTGYTLVVQPPERPDGGATAPPFDLAPGEEIDYPDPIPGCATEPPAAEPRAAKTKPKTAPAADGGDQK